MNAFSSVILAVVFILLGVNKILDSLQDEIYELQEKYANYICGETDAYTIVLATHEADLEASKILEANS